MAKNISEIDTNFKVETSYSKDGFAYYNIDNEPFRIYGIFREGDKYRRMPEAVAKSVSDGVHFLHTNTAGGRVRFKTDSSNVRITAKMGCTGRMQHFAFTGSVGFDLYEKTDDGYNYISTYIPPFESENADFEGNVFVGEKKLRDLTINFPLYSDVCELHIGIEDGSVLLPGDEYKPELPIVYYGSSITQGGCASRAGTSYQGFICRRFDRDFINLGFSGNAKAENEMIDYICGLEMSVFVEDYDHNAPSVDHLAATHEKLYKAVRKAHPDIPVVFMSRPKYYLTDEEQQRLDIIRKTYDNAVAAGDTNVYILNGRQLMEMAKNEGTVDNCHPTDLGFASMAKALGDLFESIL